MAEKIPVKTESKAVVPGSTFDSLRREVDQLFDRFVGSGWPFSFNRPSFGIDMPWLSQTNVFVAPAVDIVERDKEYEVSAELPGLDEKNIEVKVSDSMLTIRGQKKEEKEEKEKDYYLSERRFGSFVRSFPLPAGVDANKIEANFSKGVLTVKLPKTSEAMKKEKTIEVKAG